MKIYDINYCEENYLKTSKNKNVNGARLNRKQKELQQRRHRQQRYPFGIGHVNGELRERIVSARRR